MLKHDKYLSIITNFGCHYKCPYCIVKKNNLKVPKTTIVGLNNMLTEFSKHKCDIISISGGGDPLHNYEQHVDWYRLLFDMCRNYQKYTKRESMRVFGDRGYTEIIEEIPIEMHTSYLTDQSTFPFYDCYRVVYHCHKIEDLYHIKRTGSEKVRVVFVVTKDFTLEYIMDISEFVSKSFEIDELSFRQCVDGNYQIVETSIDKYLKYGHGKLWHYIEQNDYNLYYAENQIFTRYEDLKNGLKAEDTNENN